MIAVVGCAAVALAGLYLLLVPDGGLPGFGWLFVVVGVAGVVLNLLLRARQRRDGQRPGRRR